MKRLLNTLYVTSEDARLSLDGENVVVSKGDSIAGRFPLHTLQAIEYFGYFGATPALMGECAARGIDLSFFRPSGRFLARTIGEQHGNVLLRQEQYRISDDEVRSLSIATNMIAAKIFNSRWVLERCVRDHPMQVDVERLHSSSSDLAGLVLQARTATDMAELRGVEGTAARRYFDAFDQLVLADKKLFAYNGRNRRPPMDPVNALLSFAYSLLTNDCASALEGVGLDPYVGLMHVERPGRKSLALDLVEELRSVFADRMVLTCINNRLFKRASFEWREDGSVYLGEEARRAFLGAWQKRKRETLKHPFLGEKVSWGLLPHVQAMLLARYIRGDLDGYPPFMWK